MGKCLSWKYFSLLLSLLFFHSQFPFSSSLSSNSQCSALLHFNHSLSLHRRASHCGYSYPKTGSWKEDKDCCTWDGVVCDNSTRHVIALDLSCSWLYGSIPSNSTLFLLRHLRSLNLARNDFDLSLISPEFGNFQSLTHLNLSHSRFYGEIPYEISQLSSLVSLDLSYNGDLMMTIDYQSKHQFGKESLVTLPRAIPTSLGNLTQMIYLDLSYNNFNGLLPSSIFDLPNLSVLDLERNQLVGPLPNHVSGLNLLIDLSLSSNFLNGTLPSWLFSLTSLMKLTLHQNQFIGEIGEFKYNNSLDYLDLSYNMLQGSIPSSISRLVSLTTLDLSSNNLQGSVPSSISRLVNLNTLHLSSNNLSIMLDLELFSNLNVFNFSYNNLLVSINNNLTFTLPNLTELYLSSCNISEFPIFLKVATNLGSLDLSNNRIYGQTPEWLGAVGRNSLTFLDLSHNFLTSIDKIPWKNLYSVDLRNNLLQGPLPTLNALSLRYLFASNNNLSGGIPSFICNASSLEVLDLSHNNFSGTIPKCLVLSNALLVFFHASEKDLELSCGSGENKGFAFVTFRSAELASQAIEELNNTEFKKLGRAGSKEGCPGGWAWSYTTVELVKNAKSPSNNRGFAFVDYHNPACAEYLRQKERFVN
ncbi:hypothetical protein CMV_027433 [Castanea mollissima]|uniref:RRM domain-containing protein n=1 Tax=Castanea mollissima TaxID=60419 RepID=A0A8J4V2S2_9ROSI|nr:hypothetical protein CMV_027433 [Castanea mollissima]